MKKVVLFLGVLIISFSFISAIDGSDFEMFCQHTNVSNFEQFQIPSYVPYNNEIFGFHILQENFSGSLELKDGKVVSVSCEENKDKTYDIYIQNLTTIEDFQNSGNPLGVFNEKLGDGEITVKGVSFGKKVKFAVTKFVLRFLS